MAGVRPPIQHTHSRPDRCAKRLARVASRYQRAAGQHHEHKRCPCPGSRPSELQSDAWHAPSSCATTLACSIARTGQSRRTWSRAQSGGCPRECFGKATWSTSKAGIADSERSRRQGQNATRVQRIRLQAPLDRHDGCATYTAHALKAGSQWLAIVASRWHRAVGQLHVHVRCPAQAVGPQYCRRTRGMPNRAAQPRWSAALHAQLSHARQHPDLSWDGARERVFFEIPAARHTQASPAARAANGVVRTPRVR